MKDKGSLDKAYWLKMQRKKKGLTQRELADLAGTSLRSIQSYEQGTRNLAGASVELVRALCQVLECSEGEILSYPGSRGGSFGAYTDEALCALYARLMAEEGVPRELLEGQPQLSAAELKGQLWEEMALRFYQGHTKQRGE